MLRTKFVNNKNNQKGWTQYFKIIYLQRNQEKLKKFGRSATIYDMLRKWETFISRAGNSVLCSYALLAFLAICYNLKTKKEKRQQYISNRKP